MRELTPEQKRRLRGTILQLLLARHDMQMSRMDDVAIAHALLMLTWDLSIEQVVTMLQDLEDRGYVRFIERRCQFPRRVTIEKIELTSAGRDIVEENDPEKRDPAVEL